MNLALEFYISQVLVVPESCTVAGSAKNCNSESKLKTQLKTFETDVFKEDEFFFVVQNETLNLQLHEVVKEKV